MKLALLKKTASFITGLFLVAGALFSLEGNALPVQAQSAGRIDLGTWNGSTIPMRLESTYSLSIPYTASGQSTCYNQDTSRFFQTFNGPFIYVQGNPQYDSGYKLFTTSSASHVQNGQSYTETSYDYNATPTTITKTPCLWRLDIDMGGGAGYQVGQTYFFGAHLLSSGEFYEVRIPIEVREKQTNTNGGSTSNIAYVNAFVNENESDEQFQYSVQTASGITVQPFSSQMIKDQFDGATLNVGSIPQSGTTLTFTVSGVKSGYSALMYANGVRVLDGRMTILPGSSNNFAFDIVKDPDPVDITPNLSLTIGGSASYSGAKGSSAPVSWSGNNVRECVASWAGNVDPTGNDTITVDAAGTYTVTCKAVRNTSEWVVATATISSVTGITDVSTVTTTSSPPTTPVAYLKIKSGGTTLGSTDTLGRGSATSTASNYSVEWEIPNDFNSCYIKSGKLILQTDEEVEGNGGQSQEFQLEEKKKDYQLFCLIGTSEEEATTGTLIVQSPPETKCSLTLTSGNPPTRSLTLGGGTTFPLSWTSKNVDPADGSDGFVKSSSPLVSGWSGLVEQRSGTQTITTPTAAGQYTFGLSALSEIDGSVCEAAPVTLTVPQENRKVLMLRSNVPTSATVSSPEGTNDSSGLLNQLDPNDEYTQMYRWNGFAEYQVTFAQKVGYSLSVNYSGTCDQDSSCSVNGPQANGSFGPNGAEGHTLIATYTENVCSLTSFTINGSDGVITVAPGQQLNLAWTAGYDASDFTLLRNGTSIDTYDRSASSASITAPTTGGTYQYSLSRDCTVGPVTVRVVEPPTKPSQVIVTSNIATAEPQKSFSRPPQEEGSLQTAPFTKTYTWQGDIDYGFMFETKPGYSLTIKKFVNGSQTPVSYSEDDIVTGYANEWADRIELIYTQVIPATCPIQSFKAKTNSISETETLTIPPKTPFILTWSTNDQSSPLTVRRKNSTTNIGNPTVDSSGKGSMNMLGSNNEGEYIYVLTQSVCSKEVRVRFSNDEIDASAVTLSANPTNVNIKYTTGSIDPAVVKLKTTAGGRDFANMPLSCNLGVLDSKKGSTTSIPNSTNSLGEADLTYVLGQRTSTGEYPIVCRGELTNSVGVTTRTNPVTINVNVQNAINPDIDEI